MALSNSQNSEIYYERGTTVINGKVVSMIGKSTTYIGQKGRTVISANHCYADTTMTWEKENDLPKDHVKMYAPHMTSKHW